MAFMPYLLKTHKLAHVCETPRYLLHAMLGFAAKCLPAARNYFAVV